MTPGEERILEWNGLQLGDPVKVRDEPRSSFRFRAFVRDARGHEFVEVFGGKRGYEKIRFFRAERIIKVRLKFRRRAG